MHALACKRVEKYRQGRYEGLTFTRRHFRNLALVEGYASDELNVIVDHVPDYLVSTCNPMVYIYCLVAFDADEVLVLAAKVAVKLVCGDNHLFVFFETPGC